MFYDFAITVPANTAVSSPKEVNDNARDKIHKDISEWGSGC